MSSMSGLSHADLNLLIQIISMIIIFVSLYFKRKGKLKLHGTVIGIAVVIHALTFILIMGPIFSESFTFFSTETSLILVQTTWLHAIPGAIALLLAVLLLILWIINPSNTLACFKRKRTMDATLVLWLFSLAFGIVTYILFYL
ncbi:hypothetical protein KJN74_00700 [Candidatus Bathyarchaeota archaeon]|nr:hypothetical protein [Candidatus Bathyarchaeota archaeon]